MCFLEILDSNLLVAVIGAVVAFRLSQRLEKFRDDQRTLERAELVARLFAEWQHDPEDRRVLNQLSYECAMWLPAELVKKLAARLIHAPSANSVQDLVVEVRGLLRGRRDEIQAADVVWFTKKA